MTQHGQGTPNGIDHSSYAPIEPPTQLWLGTALVLGATLGTLALFAPPTARAGACIFPDTTACQIALPITTDGQFSAISTATDNAAAYPIPLHEAYLKPQIDIAGSQILDDGRHCSTSQSDITIRHDTPASV
ncbi:MAG TPA: hypothetical protein P5114_13495 [Hyphomicrobiaceae bacterium]|nr:hypothetical protein [Hyphomicrobiaceae bacterium]